jgi:trigger factor
MSTVVESLGKLERKMTLTFARSELAQEKLSRLTKLTKTARIPGFRQGKVPLKVIERQYGPTVEAEVQFDRAVRLFFENARAQSLRVVGQPRIEPKLDQDVSEQVVFDAVFEVYPEIKIGDLSQLTLSSAKTIVGDAEVDKTIEVLRKQRMHFHSRGEQGEHGDGGSDTSAQDGDRVTVDFVGKIDDVAFPGGQADNFAFELGAGQMLPEFEQAARGLKVGDTKEFVLHFPDDYHAKEVAGKEANFSLTVRKVEWAHKPEIDDVFVRSLGIVDGSVDKMRADIRENLEREVKRRVRAMLKNQVMEGLLSVTPVDVPKSLLDQECANLVELARQDMEQRGMKQARSIPIPPETFAQQAERRVKLGLILAELVKEQQLQAKPEQVEAEVSELAKNYQDAEEVKRWYYADRTRLADVEAIVVENNVVEFVCTQATVQDKTLSFDELTAASM